MKVYERIHVHTDPLQGYIYVDNITSKPITGIIKRVDGSVEYCVKGVYHREDGPAYISNDGTEIYYLNDIKYTKEEYTKELKKRGIKPTSEYFKNLL